MPNLTREQRLARRAARAHERAKKRGDTQVGTRKTSSNPRMLNNSDVPVYKREAKLRGKQKKTGERKKKRTDKKNTPKQNLGGRIKDAVTSNKRPKKGRSKTEKAQCSFDNKAGRARNKRKHSSCKA